MARVRVLVMGGTRFNGLSLVRELVGAGHDVAVLNRGVTAATLPGGVRRLVADRSDRAQLHAALGGAEFDCVHDVSGYRPGEVSATIELLQGRVGHYVFVSSTVIYAPSDLLPITEDHPVDRSARQNEYGLHKLLCEDLLFDAHARAGFPATVAALSMVLGPGNIVPDREQRMFARLLEGRPVLVPGDGTTLGQVGYVDDQSVALRMMMGNERTFGRRYNVTGDQYHTDDGYVATIADVVGVTPTLLHLPARMMDDLWDGRIPLDGGAVAVDDAAVMRQRWQLSMLVQRMAPNLHRWNHSVLFSVDRLREDVGWRPAHRLRQMVEETYGWWRHLPAGERATFDFGWEDALAGRLRGRPEG